MIPYYWFALSMAACWAPHNAQASLTPPDRSSTNGDDDRYGSKEDELVNGLIFLIVIIGSVCLLFCVGRLFLVYWIQPRFLNHDNNDPANGEATNPVELEPLRDGSPLAQEAGLAPGLLLTERMIILKAFFQPRIRSYSDIMAEQERHNQKNPEHQEEPITTCSICLVDYDNNNNDTEVNVSQELVQGTQCHHVFHYQCCMEWLEPPRPKPLSSSSRRGRPVPQITCPNCRVDLLTPEQFRQAAAETLGPDRMQQIASRHAATTSRTTRL